MIQKDTQIDEEIIQAKEDLQIAEARVKSVKNKNKKRKQQTI